MTCIVIFNIIVASCVQRNNTKRLDFSSRVTSTSILPAFGRLTPSYFLSKTHPRYSSSDFEHCLFLFFAALTFCFEMLLTLSLMTSLGCTKVSDMILFALLFFFFFVKAPNISVLHTNVDERVPTKD